jgi:single-strand DNA-binding protein
MPDFNQITLMGRLTRDPELKTVNSTSLANLSLAVGHTYVSNGEKKEEVDYFNCVAWGKLADTLTKYFSKGKPIFVQGRMKLETWENSDGKKSSRHVVVIETFKFLEKANQDSGSSSSSGAPPAQSSQYDDDIPF